MVSKSFWTVSCPLVKLQTSHFLFLHVTVEDSDGADSWVRGRSDVVWCCFHPFYPGATKTGLFLFFSGGWQPALADLSNRCCDVLGQKGWSKSCGADWLILVTWTCSVFAPFEIVEIIFISSEKTGALHRRLHFWIYVRKRCNIWTTANESKVTSYFCCWITSLIFLSKLLDTV